MQSEKALPPDSSFMIAAEGFFAYRRKANATSMPCQICVRLAGKKRKKDSRPVDVSPYAVNSAGNRT